MTSLNLVLSNTIFRISLFRTTDSHRTYTQSDSLKNKASKVVFPNQLTMFAGILLETF